MSHIDRSQAETQPAYKPAPASKKPWWAQALIGGIGVGLTIGAMLGLPARGNEPREVHPSVAASSPVPLPAGALSLDDRLRNIESTLTAVVNGQTALVTEVSDLKSRLPKQKP